MRRHEFRAVNTDETSAFASDYFKESQEATGQEVVLAPAMDNLIGLRMVAFWYE